MFLAFPVYPATSVTLRKQLRLASDRGAAKALAAYNYRVVKYIGAYTAAMDGVDVIAFTAGLGENGKSMRKAVCEHLSYLGIKIDDEANSVRGKDIVISTPIPRLKLW